MRSNFTKVTKTYTETTEKVDNIKNYETILNIKYFFLQNIKCILNYLKEEDRGFSRFKIDDFTFFLNNRNNLISFFAITTYVSLKKTAPFCYSKSVLSRKTQSNSKLEQRIESWVSMIWFSAFRIENNWVFIAFILYIKLWFDKGLCGKYKILLIALKVTKSALF